MAAAAAAAGGLAGAGGRICLRLHVLAQGLQELRQTGGDSVGVCLERLRDTVEKMRRNKEVAAADEEVRLHCWAGEPMQTCMPQDAVDSAALQEHLLPGAVPQAAGVLHTCEVMYLNDSPWLACSVVMRPECSNCMLLALWFAGSGERRAAAGA
jgi:hypothetical protein